MGPRHDTIRFTVRPVAPYRLDLTAWTLRRRPMNAIDTWDGTTYGRVLVFDNNPAWMTVTQRERTLHVTVAGRHLPSETKQTATKTLEWLLGTRQDLSEFYEFSARHPRLDKLAARFYGVKPPRFATAFEALVNGITCQQLSLTVGIIFMNRLSERFGVAYSPGKYAFPRPEDLASLAPADLRPLGYSGSKARALIELAQSIAAGQLDLEELRRLDNRQCVERLIALRGVGRWTAEYVLLRGLGRIDVFPGDDVGARNSLERWLKIPNKLDYEGTQKVLKKWKDYGGLIFFHLLLKGLDEAGDLGLLPGVE